MKTYPLFFLPQSTPPILAIQPSDSGPIFIDFEQGKKAHRRQFGGGKNQPLGKAIGLHQKSPLKLIDATAGMGGDGFVFASLGCKVTLIERAPEIAALLEDALKRGQNSALLEVKEIVQRMQLIHQDATAYLTQHKPMADVIYLDPMYPEKKKKAAPKKEMALLQKLVGPDLDSEKLLQAALNCPWSNAPRAPPIFRTFKT